LQGRNTLAYFVGTKALFWLKFGMFEEGKNCFMKFQDETFIFISNSIIYCYKNLLVKAEQPGINIISVLGS